MTDTFSQRPRTLFATFTFSSIEPGPEVGLEFPHFVVPVGGTREVRTVPTINSNWELGEIKYRFTKTGMAVWTMPLVTSEQGRLVWLRARGEALDVYTDADTGQIVLTPSLHKDAPSVEANMCESGSVRSATAAVDSRSPRVVH